MDDRKGPGILAPWRLLVLDRTDPQDAKWVIATVTLASDVRPAEIGSAAEPISGVHEWVRHRLGRRSVRLTPVRGMAWTISEGTG